MVRPAAPARPARHYAIPNIQTMDQATLHRARQVFDQLQVPAP